MSRELCMFVCWAVAVVVGAIVGYVAANALGLGFWVGLIVGLLATFGVGWFLPEKVCQGAAEPAAPPARAAAPSAPPKPASAPSAAPAPSAAASSPAEEAAPAPVAAAAAPAGASGGHWSDSVAADSGKAGAGRGQTGLKPTAALAEEDTLRDGVGSWRYESGAKPYRSSDAPASATAAPLAEDYDGDGVVEGRDEGERPEALDGPRGGVADDLKKIKGVGPKMETLLNSLGFYHYDQVAGWSDQEVAWVDANLEGFKGRVSRDEWVAQARLLASGGETEFSKKVDKGDVY